MTNTANTQKKKARWPLLVATGAALAAVTAGMVPAAATGRPAPAPSLTHVTSDAAGPLDRKALREAIGGLPDRVVTGALVKVSGREGRWTGTAGPSVPSADAHFRIGSATKLFTSAIALQLVGEDRLRMDSTVREVLPGVLPADYPHDITLGQLLSHTSGLPQPKCVEEGPPAHVVATALSCADPTKPGETSQYNGINYFIVGMMIEKVTGRSYAQELNARILRPLGLRHTSLPDPDDRSVPTPYTRAAVAKTPEAKELTDITESDPWPWAEGGMISNAPDLTRFIRALLGGRLLEPAQQKLLFTIPEAKANGATFSWGGLMRHQMDNGTVVWGKTGSYAGYTSGVFATRDLGRVLVYSMNPTNRAPETGRVMAIANAAFQGVASK
ncbi:serine hydrolase domain-containing protein [Streptomyces sp. NPDC000410]|uniref:serine hydrolase domain-containing protein n=1 Tax=Streptomyces sp. NPDC000410 TaxID=3154254 RepID=UPI0033226D95